MVRYSNWPLISPEDIRPFDDRLEVVGVFNPGVTMYEDQVLLLLRVAVRPKAEEGKICVLTQRNGEFDICDLSNDCYDCSDERVYVGKDKKYLSSLSYFTVAVSRDGIHFEIKEDSVLLPSEELESYGIEDPRIIHIDDYYYVIYSGVSECGICGMLGRTKDFRSFEKLGAILHPDNKDATLFPEKINGKYYMLHRPASAEFSRVNIWIAESDTLTEWGNHRCIMKTRPGEWDGARIGSSGVPFKTDKGWLVVYHGSDKTNRYCLGAMLLDLNEPWKVIGRTKKPFLEPMTGCEKNGFFSNVVFSCGGISTEESLKIYYGAADKYVCGGEINISEIMNMIE